MSTSAVKLTYADLLALPDDRMRHELVDGEHYVTAAPTQRHQEVLGNLFWVIKGFVRAQRLGKVFVAPFDVFLSDFDVLEPDLLFVGRARLAQLEERFVRGAPDLAVEVLSPSTRGRDLTIKRRVYRQFGVGEYWIVDPAQETIEIFRGGDTWFRAAESFSRAAGPQTFSSPLFPGLVLSLDQIFE
jgi:Uma2 family endonuclease